MLGSPFQAPATTQTTSTNASSTQSSPAGYLPSRPSRLRGLSLFRSLQHPNLNPPEETSRRGYIIPASPNITRANTSPTITRPVRSNSSRRRAEIEAAEITDRPLHSPTRQSVFHSTIADPVLIGLAMRERYETMTRSRAATDRGSTPTPSSPPVSGPPVSGLNRTMSARRTSITNPPSASNTAEPSSSIGASSSSKENFPTIKFIPHVETRSARPSLHFTAMSRTLKTPQTVVRVGRYSDRDLNAPEPDVIPVGFKSKVVSRRHCEFWCKGAQWYVKDVKSSSGTFLNHVRLSAPGTESRPFPVNDGDIVQLGIDFKGGEEVIFRCVKIRIECNRGWQKSLNAYNTSAHKRLLEFSQSQQQSNGSANAPSSKNGECAICLMSIAPCQALFVAPCSHVWHYKCVAKLITGPHYPNFICPNCRFVADLEAEVDLPEEYEGLEEEAVDENDASNSSDKAEKDVPAGSTEPTSGDSAAAAEPSEPGTPRDHLGRRILQTRSSFDLDDDELTEMMARTAMMAPRAYPQPEDLDASLENRTGQPTFFLEGTPSPSVSGDDITRTPRSQPVPIAARRTPPSANLFNGARSTTPTTHTLFAVNGASEEEGLGNSLDPVVEATILDIGPMTPRNDAGPFVLDGSAGRDRGTGEMANVEGILNGASEELDAHKETDAS